jgi:hypothetical protein
MAEPEGKQEEYAAPKIPDRGYRAERDECERDDDGNAAVILTREAVHDMSAVELPNWKQIEGGREQSHPGGPADGMKQDRIWIQAGMKK